jgi:CheY-like chemotaxis protein
LPAGWHRLSRSGATSGQGVRVAITAEVLIPLLIQNQYADIHESLDVLLETNPEWVAIELRDEAGGLIYPLNAPAVPASDEYLTVVHDLNIRGNRLATLVLTSDLGGPLATFAAKTLPDIAGTVLYIEDNPANLELMQLIVKRIKGLSLISATDAETGIELAKNESPDLIILDINLPGMDGFEALEKLQGLEGTKEIPVIALSANAMPKEIEKGMEAGFRQYLTKPIKVEEVVSSVRNALAS